MQQTLKKCRALVKEAEEVSQKHSKPRRTKHRGELVDYTTTTPKEYEAGMKELRELKQDMKNDKAEYIRKFENL